MRSRESGPAVLGAIGLLALFAGAAWSQESPVAAVGRAPDRESELGAQQFSEAPPPNWIVAVPVPDPKPSSEPNTLRLGDVQIRWTAGGESAFHHYIMTANNTAGVTAQGQLTMDFNPAFQTFTLHTLRVLRGQDVVDKLPKAKVRFLEREPGLEQSVYTGVVTVAIVIDDMRVGDTLEYAYSTVGSNPVFSGAVAGAATWESIYPVQLRRVSIQVPRDRALRYRFIGANNVAGNVIPAEAQRDGFKEFVFEQRDIAPFHAEGSYPPGYQPVTWLQYSEYASWNQVAKWAAGLFQTPAPTGSDFRNLVASLRAVHEPGKRAAQALAFVQSEIRYTSVAFGENSHRPASPDEVLRRRYGDCKDKALLLASVYRALGLEARPVLLGVAAHKGLEGWLPGPTPFDHAIVQLRLKDNTYWVDATAQQKPQNIASVGRLHGGSDVLVADSRSERLVQIEQPKPELYSTIERVHLDNFVGPATLERVVTFSGTMAENMRWTISQTSPDELKKNVLNQIQRAYGTADWAQDLVVADDGENNTLILRERVTLAKYAEHVDGGWLMRHRASIAPFFTIPDTPRRNAPYAVQFPLKVYFLHEVELPQGASQVANDVVLEVKDPFFNVRQVQKRKGAIASTEYEFETVAEEVPAAQMDRFAADIRKVQNDFHPSILVAPAQAGSGGDRQDPTRLAVKAAATRGDARAQNKLGLMYVEGQGVVKDYKEALSWFGKAAAQNFADAEFNLGRMYYQGLGTPQDFETALAWFRKAAEKEVARARYYVGFMYIRGEGVPRDFTQALTWYRKAADQGYGPAQYDLAWMYESGSGVPRDSTIAFALYRKAADQGVPAAQAALGMMYAAGEGGVPQDYAEAYSISRKAADQGNAFAQNTLAWLYEKGLGVQQDTDAAIQWYRKAADQGLAKAQLNLGRKYFLGEGVAKDCVQAVSLWQKSADRGETGAQFALGLAYESGQGVTKDVATAASWYRKAAQQRNPTAQNSLGVLYQKGLGVPRDLVQAHLWYNLAASSGDEPGRHNRDMVASQMTAQQVADAQKLAREWKPTASAAVASLAH